MPQSMQTVEPNSETFLRQFSLAGDIVNHGEIKLYLHHNLGSTSYFRAYEGYYRSVLREGKCIVHSYREADRRDWVDEVAWFRDKYPSHALNYSYMDSFGLPGLCFTVMRAPTTTLRTALDVADLRPFSRRQALEVIVQVMDGVNFLHSEGALFGDLTPESIELKEFSVVESRVYDSQTRHMVSKAMLRSTKLRVIFTGTGRLEGACNPRIMAYQAPELVLGLDFSAKADAFSVGCIAFEVMATTPLFTQALKRLYLVESMFYQYEIIIGPLPASMISRVVKLPGVIGHVGALGRLGFQPVIYSGTLLHHISHVDIKDDISDTHARAFIKALVDPDSQRRLGLQRDEAPAGLFNQMGPFSTVYD